MSDSQHAGFGKFVPGFDFLQGLAKGQAAQMPGLGNWVAPTLDPQELDKRISELKAVQFWLDQNATALKATIQALEVQKMTLATLKGMNLDMGAMAQAFKSPAATSAAAPSGDPMQLWASLTQQFQQIATGAMQEVARQTATASASSAAKSGTASAASKKAATRKPAKKPAARSR